MELLPAVHIRVIAGLIALTASPLLFGFLCFPLIAPKPSGVPTPTSAAIFEPTVSASVSNPTPGAPSNVVTHISLDAGNTLPIGLAFDVPFGWAVANDANVGPGSIVGSIAGFFTIDDPAPVPPFTFFGCTTTVDFDPTDVPPSDIKLLDATTNNSVTVPGRDTDGNGKPDIVETDVNGLPAGVTKYPAFLDAVLAPVLAQWGGTMKARYFGHTEAAGVSDLYVNIIVLQLPNGTHRVIAVTNDPTAPPESATNRFCAPMALTMTLLGVSADNPNTILIEGGQTVYANPPAAGAYTFSAALVSEFDYDNDGASNGMDNCPSVPNPSQTDADEDYFGDGAGCDQNPTQDFDVDGDGIENGYDNCMFAPNSATLGPNNQLDTDLDDLGDACDPDPFVPNGANHYLTCTDPVGIGQNDPGGATCFEDVPDPLPTPTPKDPNSDTDGDTSANGQDDDDDNDGCTDERELGFVVSLGGRRDPHNFWDFFDVPVPNTVPARDKAVSVSDILLVVTRFGSHDNNGTSPINRMTDPLSAPPKSGYHPAYDRTNPGPNNWNLGPPDGSVAVNDIVLAVVQFGHSCL